MALSKEFVYFVLTLVNNQFTEDYLIFRHALRVGVFTLIDVPYSELQTFSNLQVSKMILKN